MCLGHIVICSLSGSKYFFTLSHKSGTIFGGGGGKVSDHKIRILIFSTTFFFFNFPCQEELSEIWSTLHTGLHAKYQFFLSDFNETSILTTDFRKSSNMNFHKKNPSSLSRGNGRKDRQAHRHDESNSRFSQYCERAYKFARNRYALA